MTDHFQRMPAFLQDRIHAEGWTSWRPVQQESFDVLFDSEDHLLICAGTSSGKTEAAMLPVISSLCNDPVDGVGAMYIGPTKALIDDQFSRLDRMLRDSRLTITGWHGDIPKASKDRMRDRPEGILQITPESLQGVICDGPELLRRMFPSLRFVVIDEVHTFMASDRGLQLLCELDAIERIAGCSPRRIGLSATLSDIGGAEDWLRAGTDRGIRSVSSESDSTGRIGIKYYRIPADEENRRRCVQDYYRDMFRLTDQHSCIVFTNSRGSAERTARSLAKVSRSEGSQNQVRIHHGSLSGTLRKEAEEDLKEGRHPTVVATSTLELGMDVGGLDRVLQIGAPYTCSSMLQRMGRTGRRGGKREMVMMVMDDMKKWTPSPPGMSLELVRAIAVTDLGLKGGWTEGIRPNPLPFGLLYHQMVAYLKGSDHDVRWPELRDSMLRMWSFRNISREEARELAMHMLSEGHLQRLEDGTLVIGLKAEPIANGRGFASVFETPMETEIRFGGKVIGTVQGNPKEGRLISLAGKVWLVTGSGDGWADVREAGDGSAESKWESAPPEVDDRVMRRMREILRSDETFRWLDSAASAELEATRSEFREKVYDGPVETSVGYTLFPWTGTRNFEGLRRALMEVPGVEVLAYASPLWIMIGTDRTWGMVEQSLKNHVPKTDAEDYVLLEDVEDMGKYERFVPEGLRAREYAAHRLSFDFVSDMRRSRRVACIVLDGVIHANMVLAYHDSARANARDGHFIRYIKFIHCIHIDPKKSGF